MLAVKAYVLYYTGTVLATVLVDRASTNDAMIGVGWDLSLQFCLGSFLQFMQICFLEAEEFESQAFKLLVFEAQKVL